MPKLKTNNIVSCAIRSGIIVNPYEDYDEIGSFVIVAVYENYGYYIFIPYYINLHNSETVNAYKCSTLNIDKKYMGENMAYITSSMIASVVCRDDDIKCKMCKDVCAYAEPNQLDESFICYRCRFNPHI